MKNFGAMLRACGGGGLVRTLKSLSFGAVVATAAISAPAHAVTGYPFELDGNLTSNGKVDWASLYDVSAPGAVPTPKVSPPSGFTSASFARDFVVNDNSDATTFSTGSKDTLSITGGWQCGASNNISDKVDLLNAYAVSYVDPTTKANVVYFGLETASNEGSRNVGFWFLKDGSVACTASGGKNSNFTGNHVDGDLLVVAEYSGGGGVSLINVYRWNGGASGTLSLLNSGVDCANSGPSANVCGSTNRAALIGSQVPWLTKTKTSNPSVPNLKATDLDRGEFFEGALNLTGLGLTACFGKFLADTRSSTSTTATIFDFTIGKFSSCSIGVAKTCAVTRVTTDAERTQYGKNFLASFTGYVTNTGGASIPSGTTISVVDDAGTPAPTTGDDVSQILTLAADLLPDGQKAFSGQFFTNQNPPNNTVSASTVVGGTAINATPFSIECTSIVLNSTLSVVKNCGIPAALNGGVAKPGTELVLSGGVLAVKVNVSGKVCNDSPAASAYPYLSVSAGEQEGLNPSTTQLGSAITGFPVNLAPGACQTFAFSYTPAAADGLISPASNAMFTDTVSAIGSHPALPVAQQPKASNNAHCPLCTCTGTGCTVP